MKKSERWLHAAALGIGLAVPAVTGAAAPSSAQFDIIQQQQGQGVNVTTTAKVWVKGSKFRLETKNPMVGEFLLISDGANVYALNPKQMQGTKRPASAKGQKPNPWAFITQDVEKLRAKGKKVGQETIEGVACDVYAGSESKPGASGGTRSGSFKAWLANVSGVILPMKLVIQESMSQPGASMSSTKSLMVKNLKTNIPVADSQFLVPKGYKIATGSNGPGMLPGMPRSSRP